MTGFGCKTTRGLLAHVQLTFLGIMLQVHPESFLTPSKINITHFTGIYFQVSVHEVQPLPS